MKVTEVIARLVTREMGGDAWNPRMRWTAKPMVLVFVVTDTGLVGVGEPWITQSSPRALIATIEDDVAPLLIGKDPFMSARLAHDVLDTTIQSNRAGTASAALAAVDLALWDIAGKAAGLPLAKLLGAHADRVFCYASAGLYGRDKGPDALAAEMAGYVDRGFTMVKMKVGGAAIAEDVGRVAAVREAIGPERRLMVDGLYNFTVDDAIRFARKIERYDIEWFEAPVNCYDVAGQAKVAHSSPIPVCGNETEPTLDRFRELIQADAVRLVQFDVAACGGITVGRRIAALAQAFHRQVTLHASSTSVLMAATLQLGASLPNLHSVEYHMVHQWFWEHAPGGGFAIEDGGWVRPPDRPGIGIELDPNSL